MRDSPASLLATKSCDKADRDTNMWCDLLRGVNGPRKPYPKFSGSYPKPVRGDGRVPAKSTPVDARAKLPVSKPVEVLRVPLDPELRGKPVRCRRCPRNCKRRAAVQSKSLKPCGFGKAGQQRRPVSQETCPDEIFVHGRGVPVVRQADVARATFPARVRHAFAPNKWG